MSNVFDTSATTTTTLPSWYTDAQKEVAAQAGAAFKNTVAPNATVGADLVKSMSGPNNYFTNAMNTLQGVASGNANPFLPNGQPNTNTALGGLFSAQNANLNQMLPSITAKEGAVGIGSGGFGSLRGQTATNTARAGALTTLAEQQNKAALDAQTQAIQAGQAIGNIGSQYNTAGTNLANWQMAGALPAVSKFEDILGSMSKTLPTSSTVVNSKGTYNNALNTLNAIGGLSGAAGLGSTDLGKILGGSTGISWLDNMIKSGFSSPPDTSSDTNAPPVIPDDTTFRDPFSQGGSLYDPGLYDNTFGNTSNIDPNAP